MVVKFSVKRLSEFSLDFQQILKYENSRACLEEFLKNPKAFEQKKALKLLEKVNTTDPNENVSDRKKQKILKHYGEIDGLAPLLPEENFILQVRGNCSTFLDEPESGSTFKQQAKALKLWKYINRIDSDRVSDQQKKEIWDQYYEIPNLNAMEEEDENFIFTVKENLVRYLESIHIRFIDYLKKNHME